MVGIAFDIVDSESQEVSKITKNHQFEVLSLAD
jgi:hypothetical protein